MGALMGQRKLFPNEKRRGSRLRPMDAELHVFAGIQICPVGEKAS